MLYPPKIAALLCFFVCVSRICLSQPAAPGTIGQPSHLLDGKPATAQWIWAGGDFNPVNQYLLVQKSFYLEKTPDSVIAYISAYSFADVYVNGQLVDRCPINCDPEFQVYEKFNISRLFRKGENIISAIVYNYGVGMHHRIKARGGFFFQAKANLGNHNIIEINTDNSWLVNKKHGWAQDTELRTGSGEHRPNLIGFVEKFDNRKMPGDWLTKPLAGEGWEKAVSLGAPPVAPWNRIVLVQRPALARKKVLPVKHWQSKGFVVYDFGEEITGTPELVVASSVAGAGISIGTAERLLPDSTADFKRRVNYEDQYISSKGLQSWGPVTWRGFRYLAVKASDSVQIREVSAINRHYAVEDAGSFECSDPLLNKIWHTGRFTLKLCSQDTYMDTPWREQTQYIAGDSRYLMKYAYYASGLSSEFLTRYNILSGAWSQRWLTDGSIRSRYPTDWLIGEGTSGYLVDYELEWVIMLKEYHDYFGNNDLIRQVYPNLQLLMKKFESFVGKPSGVMQDVPGWIVLDHPDTYPMDLKKEITALNCLYYGALKNAAWLAGTICADQAQQDRWETQAKRLKENIERRFWNSDKGLYADGYGSTQYSQQTQVYALLYDLVPQANKQSAVQYISSLNRASEMSFAYYVLYALFDREPQWSVDYIRKYWGDQMKLPTFNGAWHEGWKTDEWTGDYGSTSHAWCSGPTALLPQKVLGVETLGGGSEFVIRPRAADLKWARGVIPATPGNIVVGWKNNKKRMNYTVTIPAQARAFLPLDGNTRVNGNRISPNKPGDGITTFQNSRGLWLPPGRHNITMFH